MTLAQKYDALRAALQPNERIFQHVGVRNPAGGWYAPPLFDPDEDYEIPMLRVFFITPAKTKAQVRLDELRANGWAEYTPPQTPAAVKPAQQHAEDMEVHTRRNRKK